MNDIKFLSPLAAPENESALRLNIANAKRKARTGDIAALYEAYIRYGKLFQEHNDQSAGDEMRKMEDFIRSLPQDQVVEAIQRKMEVSDFAPARWLATIIRREHLISLYKQQIASEILHEVGESEVRGEIENRISGSTEIARVVIGLDPGNRIGWCAVQGNKILAKGSIGSREIKELASRLQEEFNPEAWVFEVADNRLEYGPIKILVNSLAALISRESHSVSWRQGVDAAKDRIKLIDAQKMRYALEKYFNDKLGLTGKDQIRLRKKDQMQSFVKYKLQLGDMGIHEIDAFTVAWCYFIFHGSRVEDRFSLSRREDVEDAINKWQQYLDGVRGKKIKRQRWQVNMMKSALVGDEQHKKLLESPDIIVEPLEPFIANVVRRIKKIDPNYFKGVSKIVVQPYAHPGHVESGPGKDPNIIYVDKSHLEKEVRDATGKGLSQIAQLPQGLQDKIYNIMARVIFHEKGHILGFNPQKGYSGESEAEAHAKKMMGPAFPKAASRFQWKKLKETTYPRRARTSYNELKRKPLAEVIELAKSPNLDKDMMLALSIHPSKTVRRELAKRHDLTDYVLISLSRDKDLLISNILQKNLKKNHLGVWTDLKKSSLEEIKLVEAIADIVGKDNIRHLECKQLPYVDFEELYGKNPEVLEWIKDLIGPTKKIRHDFEIRILSGEWKRAEYFGFSNISGEDTPISDFPTKTQYDKQRLRYYVSKIIKKHFFDEYGNDSLFFDQDDLRNRNTLLEKLIQHGVIDRQGKAYGTI